MLTDQPAGGFLLSHVSLAAPAADRYQIVGPYPPVSHPMTHRVAFIGTGQMARAHLRALRQRALPITIVGVHDRTVALAEEFAQDAGARAYPSAGALLAEARPDVVHVCTPPGAHFEAAAAALEGGAHEI